MEEERTEGQNYVHSEACLAVVVQVGVDSRMDLRGKGRDQSGVRVIYDLVDQAMQDWSVSLRIPGAGSLI